MFKAPPGQELWKATKEVHVYIYIYIYTHIYREREILYIYIYTYMCGMFEAVLKAGLTPAPALRPIIVCPKRQPALLNIQPRCLKLRPLRLANGHVHNTSRLFICSLSL